MKNILFCILLSFFGVNLLISQEYDFGVKAGANLSDFIVDDFFDTEVRVGFQIGVVGVIKISERFSIQPELNYSVLGAKDTNTQFEYELNYINLPVLASYTIVKGLSLQAGPEIGYLANDELELDGITVTLDENNGFDYYGAAVGAQYTLNNLGLFFDIRYSIGYTQGTDAFNVINSNFSFCVGYFFLRNH